MNTDKYPSKNRYCGLPHWYRQCAYIVTHLRSANWKEDKAVTAKITTTRQNPVVKAKSDKAILSAEKYRQKQANSNNISSECTHPNNSSALAFDETLQIKFEPPYFDVVMSSSKAKAEELFE